MTTAALLAWLAVGALVGVIVGRAARQRQDRRRTALGRARQALGRGVRWLVKSIAGRRHGDD